MSGAARVELLTTSAERLPERLGSIARDFIADRRLAGDDRVSVQLGIASDDNTAKAMARAARSVVEPVGARIRRWLAEDTVIEGYPTAAEHLCAGFNRWAAAAGEPPMNVPAFSRALRALGVRTRLHPRSRRSEFYLKLVSDAVPE